MGNFVVNFSGAIYYETPAPLFMRLAPFITRLDSKEIFREKVAFFCNL